ncbi:hypothetical protein [Jannaschia sp. 2305UL9-9]|uniref:head-tail connector protein n=1 Tax=Jannaschia sp. 2305UL9-9 TaxID=3121638 RepID=UPI003528A3AC
MVLMVRDTEALVDAALPVARLTALMRLPEGYAAVPGQEARLQQCLRAAIQSVERRTGKILIAREVVLQGTAGGDDRLKVPVAPVSDVIEVQQSVNGTSAAITGATLFDDPHRPTLVLPRIPSTGTPIEVRVMAGWGAWDAVPAPLAQAVLMVAQALDTGTTDDLMPMVEQLIAPWRQRRIGGMA